MENNIRGFTRKAIGNCDCIERVNHHSIHFIVASSRNARSQRQNGWNKWTSQNGKKLPCQTTMAIVLDLVDYVGYPFKLTLDLEPFITV